MKFLKNNGLSIVFFVLFLITICGQAITGLIEHNEQMQDEGGQQLSMGQYITSGHFLQSTFENWESEKKIDPRWILFLLLVLIASVSITLIVTGIVD